MSPCIIWTGRVCPATGYGRRGERLAHRIAWEAVNGPIPPGMLIHHVCGVRTCINVAHLKLMTFVAHGSHHNATRTHCAKGHVYDPVPNGTKPNGRPKFTCRLCRQASR